MNWVRRCSHRRMHGSSGASVGAIEGRIKGTCIFGRVIGDILIVPDLVPQDSADGAHGRHVELVADSVRQELVADLPGEDARVALFVEFDVLHDVGSRHAWLGTTDRTGQYTSSLIIPREDLRDATMGDAQLSGDVTWPDTELGKFNNPETNSRG